MLMRKGKKIIIGGTLLITATALVFSPKFFSKSSAEKHTCTNTMEASASARTISITSDISGKGTAEIYAYQPEQYRPDDPLKGESVLSPEKGDKVGAVSLGRRQTIAIKRYGTKREDRIYRKYYLVQGGKTLKGPVYVNRIKPEHRRVLFDQDSIKGIFNEGKNDVSEASYLGASSITVNISTSSLLYPQEYAHPDNSIAYECEGKTWHFSRKAVKDMDEKITNATKAGMNSIVILNAWGKGIAPDWFRYPTDSDKKDSAIYGMNTSNTRGREYFEVMMDFLGHRYSQPERRVGTWVISNEIDFPDYFFHGENNLDRYMEEYSRQLRIADIAIKKGAGDAAVVVPFTHFWKKTGTNVGSKSPSEFLPYDMITWLAKKTNSEGAFDWGIAPHLYAANSIKANYSMADTKVPGITGDWRTTSMITYSNLEVLGDFLAQKDILFDGKRRGVYMTEGGMSSGKKSDDEYKRQAASIIQGYLKCVNLPYVRTFNYYRLTDHPDETKQGLTVGLKDENGMRKPAYEVFRKLDTVEGAENARKYLKYIEYQKNGAAYHPNSWAQAMNVYTTEMENSFDPLKALKKSELKGMTAEEKKVYVEICRTMEK